MLGHFAIRDILCIWSFVYLSTMRYSFNVTPLNRITKLLRGCLGMPFKTPNLHVEFWYNHTIDKKIWVFGWWDSYHYRLSNNTRKMYHGNRTWYEPFPIWFWRKALYNAYILGTFWWYHTNFEIKLYIGGAFWLYTYGPYYCKVG